MKNRITLQICCLLVVVVGVANHASAFDVEIDNNTTIQNSVSATANTGERVGVDAEEAESKGKVEVRLYSNVNGEIYKEHIIDGDFAELEYYYKDNFGSVAETGATIKENVLTESDPERIEDQYYFVKSEVSDDSSSSHMTTEQLLLMVVRYISSLIQSI